MVGTGILLRNAFRNTSAIPTTPSAPLRWLRIVFLMAQPPLLCQEGSGAPCSFTALRTEISEAHRPFSSSPSNALACVKIAGRELSLF